MGQSCECDMCKLKVPVHAGTRATTVVYSGRRALFQHKGIKTRAVRAMDDALENMQSMTLKR